MKKILFYVFSLLAISKGFSQTTLTQWNFNSNPADGNTATGIITPSTGTGTITSRGGTVITNFLTGLGSSDPAANADDSGLDVTGFPNQTSLPGTDKTAGIEIAVSTVGYAGIILKFDQRNANAANNTETIQYSTDGTNFTDFAMFSYASTDATNYVNGRTVDFTSITALNNNSNAKFRIVSMATSGVYLGTNAAYAGGGSWRLDMITVTYNTLPVEFVKFEVKNSEKAAVLNWSTASEKDNDLFKIEHSTNGKTYESIGEIKGKGTSYEMSHYSFEHPTPSVGVNYYRLKQVDFDGKFEYSPVRSVVFGKGKFSLKSSLVNDILPVVSNDDAITPLSIYSISGQLMQTGKVQGEQTLNIGTLPSGLYIVRTNAGDVARFTKQ
jgi:hypothetical protein